MQISSADAFEAVHRGTHHRPVVINLGDPLFAWLRRISPFISFRATSLANICLICSLHIKDFQHQKQHTCLIDLFEVFHNFKL